MEEDICAANTEIELDWLKNESLCSQNFLFSVGSITDVNEIFQIRRINLLGKVWWKQYYFIFCSNEHWGYTHELKLALMDAVVREKPIDKIDSEK